MSRPTEVSVEEAISTFSKTRNARVGKGSGYRAPFCKGVNGVPGPKLMMEDVKKRWEGLWRKKGFKYSKIGWRRAQEMTSLKRRKLFGCHLMISPGSKRSIKKADLPAVITDGVWPK